MSDTAEILRRTQLKLLGKYLLDTKHPVEERAREDRTEEMELELVRSDLQLALEKSGAGNVEEILSCVQALEEVRRRAGFLTGVKAEAQLMLHLTDSGEIAY